MKQIEGSGAGFCARCFVAGMVALCEKGARSWVFRGLGSSRTGGEALIRLVLSSSAANRPDANRIPRLGARPPWRRDKAIIGYFVGVAKHHRTNRGFAPPLENVLIFLPLRAQCVGGRYPAGTGLPVQSRYRVTGRFVLRARDLSERVAAHQRQSAVERCMKVLLAELYFAFRFLADGLEGLCNLYATRQNPCGRGSPKTSAPIVVILRRDPIPSHFHAHLHAT
jgi:hypothetical protein